MKWLNEVVNGDWHGDHIYFLRKMRKCNWTKQCKWKNIVIGGEKQEKKNKAENTRAACLKQN